MTYSFPRQFSMEKKGRKGVSFLAFRFSFRKIPIRVGFHGQLAEDCAPGENKLFCNSHPLSAIAVSWVLLQFRRNFSVPAVTTNTHPPCTPQIQQPKQSTAQIICKFWTWGCIDPVAFPVQLLCLQTNPGESAADGFVALAGMCRITFFSKNR